jgi:Amt family ammonium transporter
MALRRQTDLDRSRDWRRRRARDHRAGGGLCRADECYAVCFLTAIFVKLRPHIDNSLDVFAVHGVGGMLGSLLVAVFVARTRSGAGYGGTNLPSQLGAQTIGIAAAAAWSALATVALVKLVGAAVCVRVEAHDQYEGLDFASHGAPTTTDTPPRESPFAL